AHDRAGLQFLARMHERRPYLRGSRILDRDRILALEEQTLDGSAARNALTEQPRGKHAGVVHDDKVGRLEELRKLAHGRVPDRAAPALEHEQARTAARRGLLRDQLIREREIEVGYVGHASTIITQWPRR